MRRRVITMAAIGLCALAALTLMRAAPVAADDIGTPTPAFAGEAPKEAKVNDTGEIGRYGGRLVLSVLNDPGTWNPLMSKGATDQEYSQIMQASLTGYNNEQWANTFELAKDMKVSEDGLTWTYILREGIKWSDGEPFDADDVVFTFAVVNTTTYAIGERDMFKVGDAPLPECTKIDAHTVQFKLAAVDVLFDEHVGSVRIIPEHKLGEAHAKGEFEQAWKLGENLDEIVGLGPFRIVKYSPAERAVFERNPYYWKVDQGGNRLPYIDQLISLIVPDQNTAYAKFKNGDFDTLEPLRSGDFEDANKVAEAKGFTVGKPGLSLNTNYIAFNRNPGTNAEGQPYVKPYKLKWFRNKTFRKAIAFACDRRSMVKNLLKGRGRPIYARVPPSNKQWYLKPPYQYKFSLEKAGELLDSIGYKDRDGDGVREDPDGNRLEFIINTNSENEIRTGVCTIIKEDLEKIGIKVTLSAVIFTQLVTMIRDTHNWEAYVLGWASGVPPDPLLSKNMLLSSGRLHSGWPRQEKPGTEWEAKIDELMGQLSQTVDIAERKKINAEITNIWTDELPEIYLFSSNLYVAAYDKVGNWRPTLLRPHNWWNIEELYIKK